MAAGDEGPKDTAITLGVLSAVERDSAITQRSLSNELGIALGLANAYLKRCVRKGWIKVSQAPLNRYAYYLTPRGFSEKSRLTGEYLTTSFNFFRHARRNCTALFADCRAKGRSRIVLAGAGELAEIAILSAAEAGVEIECVVDARTAAAACAGRPVRPMLIDGAGNGLPEAVIVTDTSEPQATFEAMVEAVRAAGLSEDIVLAPSLLRISTAVAQRDLEEMPAS